MNINEIFSQLAQYNALLEETTAIVDGLKDQIKKYMDEQNIDKLAGDEHKATYKSVTSYRIDTASLKKELPDVAQRYTKASTSMRFIFA